MSRIAPRRPALRACHRRSAPAHHAARHRAAGAVSNHGQKPARLHQDVRRRPARQRAAQPAPARDRDRPHNGAARRRVRMGRARRAVRREGRLRRRRRSPRRSAARPMPPAGRPRSRRCLRWSTTWSTAERSPTAPGRRYRRISTRHKSSRRSRWWAITTRSASCAAASSCRSKAGARAFRREVQSGGALSAAGTFDKAGQGRPQAQGRENPGEQRELRREQAEHGEGRDGFAAFDDAGSMEEALPPARAAIASPRWAATTARPRKEVMVQTKVASSNAAHGPYRGSASAKPSGTAA